SFLKVVRSSTRREKFFWKSGDLVSMEDFKTGTGRPRMEIGDRTVYEAKKQRSKEAKKGLHRGHRVRREEGYQRPGGKSPKLEKRNLKNGKRAMARWRCRDSSAARPDAP